MSCFKEDDWRYNLLLLHNSITSLYCPHFSRNHWAKLPGNPGLSGQDVRDGEIEMGCSAVRGVVSSSQEHSRRVQISLPGNGLERDIALLARKPLAIKGLEAWLAKDGVKRTT